MAARALLDLRLAVQPDGAVIAGWEPGWEYAWPRDSSWVAVALADTGHAGLAYQILRFLQRMQNANGTWAARYLPDGSGPVRDGRAAELDAVGWVPWAVWSWAATQRLRAGSQARRELGLLWPMVSSAADAAARSLTGDGLPRPAMDYWEDSVQVTLGTAAPLLAGLRAAAGLSADIGGPGALRDGRRWAAAAASLTAAITARFGRNGFQRTPAAGSGADAAVTFLGPPFAAPDPAVRRAARSAQRTLAVTGAAGCGPAPAGMGRPASPGPPRPRSSRCSMRPPASTPRPRGCCRGWRRTGPGWALCQSRSTPAVSRPRSHRWPGPTQSRCWPCSPSPGLSPPFRPPEDRRRKAPRAQPPRSSRAQSQPPRKRGNRKRIAHADPSERRTGRSARRHAAR